MSEPKWIEVPGKKVQDGGKPDKHHDSKGFFKFPKNGKEGVWTWAPDGDLLGTVIVVHGMFDNADTSWKGDYAHYKDSMHTPGVPLKDQFEESGLKALFVVPEAEIISGNGQEVVWRDLDTLLKTVNAPEGPVAAITHSEGYWTGAYWTDNARLVHVSLLDSMYGHRGTYEKWFKGDSKRYIDLLVSANKVSENGKAFIKKFPDDVVKAPAPPTLGKEELAKRILFMWPKHVDNLHMKLMADGVIIPALLKRVENTFLKFKGEKGVEPQTEPKPEKEAKVFESGSDHNVDSPLQSELNQIPLLNRIAIHADLVVKKGAKSADAVQAIQDALDKLLGTKLGGTGKFEDDTAKAVKKFQETWNAARIDEGKPGDLGTDGKVGAKTLLALDAALVDKSKIGDDTCLAAPGKDEEKLWEKYKAAVERSGVGERKFHDREWGVNIVGVRSYQRGVASDPQPGEFDDTIALVYKCGKGHKHVAEFLCSVDPAAQLDGAPDVHLEDGQYEYVVGEWKGKPALKPKGKVRVWIDGDEDGVRKKDDAPEEAENAGFIAPTDEVDKVPDVGDAAQLIAGGSDEGSSWATFWKIVQKDSDKAFLYTLLNGRNMAEPTTGKPPSPTKTVEQGSELPTQLEGAAQKIDFPGEPAVIEGTPFAEPTGVYWPVLDPPNLKGTYLRHVNYITRDGLNVGDRAHKGSYNEGSFGTGRGWRPKKKDREPVDRKRHHAGIDVCRYHVGSWVVACEAGTVKAINPHWYEGVGSIVIQSDKAPYNCINYGETDAYWSLHYRQEDTGKPNLKKGMHVEAGEIISRIGGMTFETNTIHELKKRKVPPEEQSGSGMVHFEMYSAEMAKSDYATRAWFTYQKDGKTPDKRPKELLDPTWYLLALATEKPSLYNGPKFEAAREDFKGALQGADGKPLPSYPFKLIRKLPNGQDFIIKFTGEVSTLDGATTKNEYVIEKKGKRLPEDQRYWVTDKQGRYEFKGLMSGNYRVEYLLPSGEVKVVEDPTQSAFPVESGKREPPPPVPDVSDGKESEEEIVVEPEKQIDFTPSETSEFNYPLEVNKLVEKARKRGDEFVKKLGTGDQRDDIELTSIVWGAGKGWFPTTESGEFHGGVDIGFPGKNGDTLHGTVVKSIASGVVWHASQAIGDEDGVDYGRVVVAHKTKHGSFFALYQHLEGVKVREGDKVAKGKELGAIGKHGDFPHLHFAIASTEPMGGDKDLVPEASADKLPKEPWNVNRVAVKTLPEEWPLAVESDTWYLYNPIEAVRFLRGEEYEQHVGNGVALQIDPTPAVATEITAGEENNTVVDIKIHSKTLAASEVLKKLANDPSFKPWDRKGDKEDPDAVTAVQNVYALLQYDLGSDGVDGKVGKSFVAATKKFQETHLKEMNLEDFLVSNSDKKYEGKFDWVTLLALDSVAVGLEKSPPKKEEPPPPKKEEKKEEKKVDTSSVSWGRSPELTVFPHPTKVPRYYSIYNATPRKAAYQEVLDATANKDFCSRYIRVITVDGEGKNFRDFHGLDGLTFGIGHFATDGGVTGFFKFIDKHAHAELQAAFGEHLKDVISEKFVKENNAGGVGDKADDKGMIRHEWFRVGLDKLVAMPKVKGLQLAHLVESKIRPIYKTFKEKGFELQFTMAVMNGIGNSVGPGRFGDDKKKANGMRGLYLKPALKEADDKGLKGVEREKFVAESMARKYAMAKPGSGKYKDATQKMLDMGFAGASVDEIMKTLKKEFKVSELKHKPNRILEVFTKFPWSEDMKMKDLGKFTLKPEEAFAGDDTTGGAGQPIADPEDACAKAPTATEEKAYEAYQKAIEAAKGKFKTDSWQLNLVGVVNDKGKMNAKRSSAFGDTIATVYTCDKGHKHCLELGAVCDARSEDSDDHDRHLLPGHYLFVFGEFQGKKALKPKTNVRVWIDTLGDGTEDSGDPERDEKELFIAPAPAGDSFTDGGRGHQMIHGGDADGSPWAGFWALVEKDKDKEFPYTYVFDLPAPATKKAEESSTAAGSGDKPEEWKVVGGVAVYRKPGEGDNRPFCYKALMHVDNDGAPNCRHPKGKSAKALGSNSDGGFHKDDGTGEGIYDASDPKTNAEGVLVGRTPLKKNTAGRDKGKYPWGMKQDKDHHPYIQGPNDPYPGFFVSGSSLVDPTKKEGDTRRYVDAASVNYICLPPNLLNYGPKSSLQVPGGADVGDLATVVNLKDRNNPKVVHAIYADAKGKNKMGEASKKLTQSVGKKDGDKFIYVVYPGSAFKPAWPVKTADFEKKAAEYFEKWGGIELVKKFFPK